MKKKLGFTLYSLALILVTVFVSQFIYPPAKDAAAKDPYACIRQDLDAKLMDGNIGTHKKFSIYYSIPSCYASNGYHLKKVFIYEGSYVAVTYENPDFVKSSSFGSGSSGGGGLSPIN